MPCNFKTVGASALLVLATLGAAHAQTPPAASAPTQEGVSVDPEKENIGKITAQAWLMLLDRGDWGTAWEASSGLFRRNVPLSTWMDAIPKLRSPLGALVERKVVDAIYRSLLPGHPSGDYVTVIFESRFQNKGDAKEIVTTMRDPDGRWRITGYQAQ